MAVKVLIVGESGAGKSASLRNFEENEVAVFNVSEKPMPFKKKLPMMKTSDMKTIAKAIKQNLVGLFSGHVRVVHKERAPKQERNHRHTCGFKAVDIEPSPFRLLHGLPTELQSILLGGF